MTISPKRAYTEPSKNDGYRVLVDRVWPRGVNRKKLQLDAWGKELPPSAELRKWFAHDPNKWKQLKRQYFSELEDHPVEVDRLLEITGAERATLVYSSRYDKFDNAIPLREYFGTRIDI
jgi:uncharacterized protein YeaO (DUF488 family)